MKGILSWKRSRCVVRVTVFLVVAALIAGMVGCAAGGGGDGETEYIAMVAAGHSHIVGLKDDGTVVAVGDNDHGQCDVRDWTDISQVAAGVWHTVGLIADGTVVAVGWNEYGQCDVRSWTDITQVAAGSAHTVGLRSDGTVVAVGYNYYGQCDIGGWTDIIQVAAGSGHTVGLRSDGTVVAVGSDSSGQCDVGGWTDIVQVAAGVWHTVGLIADGTVVAVGFGGIYTDGCLEVGDWVDIIQIAAHVHTVGLKSDGTVVAVGEVQDGRCFTADWTGIVQVSAGRQTVGLKSDGTVVAVGEELCGQCDVDDWTDIDQVAACGTYTLGVKSDGTAVTVGHWHFFWGYRPVNIGDWTGIVEIAAGVEHTVGVKSDGTVVAAGWPGDRGDGRLEVGDWAAIIQVAAGLAHTIGLKSGGTVVAVGLNWDGQCNVSGWTDIVQVAAGYAHTVALKSDGTVVAVGLNDDGQCDVSNWTDIIQVAAGAAHTVGLKSDGTVVAVGWNDYGQCDVGGWTDIVQVAAGEYHTVGLKSDGTVVAAGIGAELYKWNLGSTHHDLSISSTPGGSVTSPGEGVFTYGVGTAANLVAEPEEGYQFVRWTGDTGTVDSINARSTTVAMWGDYVITANFAMPPIRYNLNVDSTAGGSVVAPGEGTFSNDRGTVVELVAEPEEGYQFVNWTGDVETVADVDSPSTTVSTDGDYYIRANFAAVEVAGIGVTVGDWIKIEYEITGWPAGEPYPEWLKLEFLSIEGTNATVVVTMHMSDGTEQSDIASMDIGEGGGEAFGLAGFVVPRNLTTGDSVYVSGYGHLTITGETTRTYAGAERTVAYASFSEYGVQMTYYWDRQIGVMVEASSTQEGVTVTARATETNMW